MNTESEEDAFLKLEKPDLIGPADATAAIDAVAVLRASLGLLGHAANTDTVKCLHVAIQKEITAAEKRIGRTRGNEETDHIVDYKCEKVEELLGLAFIAAQSFINGFRTRLGKVSKVCDEAGWSLGLLAKNPNDTDHRGVLKRGEPIGTNGAYTAIEAINAIANYWKHKDDWPEREENKDRRLRKAWDLDGMRLSRRRTLEIVKDLGMVPFSNGNLRKASESLGVTNYKDLSPIQAILKCWADGLYREAAQCLNRE